MSAEGRRSTPAGLRNLTARCLETAAARAVARLFRGTRLANPRTIMPTRIQRGRGFGLAGLLIAIAGCGSVGPLTADAGADGGGAPDAHRAPAARRAAYR